MPASIDHLPDDDQYLITQARERLGIEIDPIPPPPANPERRYYRRLRCNICNTLAQRSRLVRIAELAPEGRNYANVCLRHLTTLSRCGNCNRVNSQSAVVRIDATDAFAHWCATCVESYTSLSCPICYARHSRVGTNRLCPYCELHFTTCNVCAQLVLRTSIVDGECADCRYRHSTCDTCGDRYCRDECEWGCPNCESPENEDFIWEEEHDNYYVEQSTGPQIESSTFALIPSASPRMFGVELEFSRSHSSLSRWIADKLRWGACADGTSGVCQEFKSPPMQGDSGMQSIERFCDYVERFDFSVSRACGYHLHLDMRGERELAIARVAAAYQIFLPLWRAFVPPSRRTNIFCSQDVVNGFPADIASGKRKPHKESLDRYSAVNWQAYHRHKTVEIRLHPGTMQYVKITNWIKAHIAFVEWARKRPVVSILELQSAALPELFRTLQSQVWSDALSEFYLGRAQKFGVRLDSPAPLQSAPTEAQTPYESGWTWTQEDRERACSWAGVSYTQVRDRHLLRAWNASYLRRRPPAIDSRILPYSDPNYREREEGDA
jgi:hypothetical protein